VGSHARATSLLSGSITVMLSTVNRKDEGAEPSLTAIFMNKNTKQRLAAYRKQCKQTGFPPSIYKKKKQPFPKTK
jgi:hypothetical protein